MPSAGLQQDRHTCCASTATSNLWQPLNPYIWPSTSSTSICTASQGHLGPLQCQHAACVQQAHRHLQAYLPDGLHEGLHLSLVYAHTWCEWGL